MSELVWSAEVFEALSSGADDASSGDRDPSRAKELRNALGLFTTGVTVLTYEADGVYHGVTVNSFTSVSLDPPLVLVSLRRTSRALVYLLERDFVVNILSDGQHRSALQFAGQPQEDHEVEWVMEGPIPRLSGAIAHFVCTPWASYDGGDHRLLVGRVLSHAQRDDDKPLLFFRGAWNGIAKTGE